MIERTLLGATLLLSLTTPASAQDTVRPRFGVSGGGGLLLAWGQSSGASALPGEVIGVDLRGGVQINDVFAVYVEPSIVFGVANNACFGMTEAVLALWAPAMLDFTIADRISLAAGGGLAAVPGESPGWTMQFRVAGYPSIRRTPSIRHGLMLGLDTRVYGLDASGSPYVGVLVMLAVGYERF